MPAPVGCGGNCLGQMRHSCDKSSVARVEPRFHWVKVKLETLTGVFVARVAESRATNRNLVRQKAETRATNLKLVRQIFGSGILSGDRMCYNIRRLAAAAAGGRRMTRFRPHVRGERAQRNRGFAGDIPVPPVNPTFHVRLGGELFSRRNAA